VGSRPGGWRIGPRRPAPKSFRLRDSLLELVTSDLTADDPIPSERELKQRFRLQDAGPAGDRSSDGRGTPL
jgi:hypothetical protein